MSLVVVMGRASTQVNILKQGSLCLFDAKKIIPASLHAAVDSIYHATASLTSSFKDVTLSHETEKELLVKSKQKIELGAIAFHNLQKQYKQLDNAHTKLKTRRAAVPSVPQAAVTNATLIGKNRETSRRLVNHTLASGQQFGLGYPEDQVKDALWKSLAHGKGLEDVLDMEAFRKKIRQETIEEVNSEKNSVEACAHLRYVVSKMLSAFTHHLPLTYTAAEGPVMVAVRSCGTYVQQLHRTKRGNHRL